jgi:hypothetical protein
MSNIYRGPSKDASYQASIHLVKRLQKRRFFRNQPIRNILVSDWLISKNLVLCQMNRNLVGSTYAMEGSVLSFLKAE